MLNVSEIFIRAPIFGVCKVLRTVFRVTFNTVQFEDIFDTPLTFYPEYQPLLLRFPVPLAVLQCYIHEVMYVNKKIWRGCKFC